MGADRDNVLAIAELAAGAAGDLAVDAVGLERGDHVELALVIIEDHTTDGVKPVTGDARDYCVYLPGTGIWQELDDRELRREIQDLAGSPIGDNDETIRLLKVRASDARGAVDVMRDQTWRRDFFRPDVLAFKNRLVAFVHRGALIVEPIMPKHGARVLLDCDLRDNWMLPASSYLEKYLATTFDAEEATRLGELAGAALCGLGVRYKKAWVLADDPDTIAGQGGTGKSTFLKLLEGLVPRARRCSIAPQQFGHEYHGAELQGKTLNLVFETPDTDILREDGVKAIVHGEPITRRPIRGTPVTFAPQALHVFAANRLPSAPGATGAFWDRFDVVFFGRRFRDADEEIVDLAERILEQEFDDLVHWALEGARRLLAQGCYSTSSAGERAKQTWKEESDPVRSFVQECTLPCDDDAPKTAWTSSAVLYAVYTAWCALNGYQRANQKKFKERLEACDVQYARASGSKYDRKLSSRGREILDGRG